MKYISDRQTTRHIEQLVEGLAALSALKSGNWSASQLVLESVMSIFGVTQYLACQFRNEKLHKQEIGAAMARAHRIFAIPDYCIYNPLLNSLYIFMKYYIFYIIRYSLVTGKVLACDFNKDYIKRINSLPAAL